MLRRSGSTSSVNYRSSLSATLKPTSLSSRCGRPTSNHIASHCHSQKPAASASFGVSWTSPAWLHPAKRVTGKEWCLANAINLSHDVQNLHHV